MFRKYKNILLITTCIVIFCAGLLITQKVLPKEDNNYEKVTLLKVIDGDTLSVKNSDKEEFKVRLIGIDTPESVNPDPTKNTEEGFAASNFTKEQLKDNQFLYLEKDDNVSDTDKYDRKLRYVWIIKPNGDLNYMLNYILLKNNQARLYIHDDPQPKYYKQFKDLKK